MNKANVVNKVREMFLRSELSSLCLLSNETFSIQGFHFIFSLQGFHFIFSLQGFHFIYSVQGFHFIFSIQGFHFIFSIQGFHFIYSIQGFHFIFSIQGFHFIYLNLTSLHRVSVRLSILLRFQLSIPDSQRYPLNL